MFDNLLFCHVSYVYSLLGDDDIITFSGRSDDEEEIHHTIYTTKLPVKDDHQEQSTRKGKLDDSRKKMKAVIAKESAQFPHAMKKKSGKISIEYFCF